jgi:outer membrane lipoprotein-sorting protein
MKRVFTALVFIILMIGLVGCEEVEKDTVSSRPAGDSGSAESADNDVSGSADASVDKGSGDSFADKFADFAGKKWKLEYTVEYGMTSKSGGQTQSMAMTQYFGGEGKIRSDITVEGRESRTFILSDGIYMCTFDQGKWMCLTFGTPDEAEQQDNTMAFQDVEKAPDNYNIAYKGTKSIAGAMTYCYGITMPTGTMEECFTKEGIPLYMYVKSADYESTMEAKSFKKSVSSGDFKLPAEPVDMQDMIQQQMEQMQANMPEGYDMPDMSDYQ